MPTRSRPTPAVGGMEASAAGHSRARQDLCARLERCIPGARVPVRGDRYEPGQVFEADITGIVPDVPGRATFEVEAFVGGGFAGQVYRVRLVALDLNGGSIPGLFAGGVYALKVLRPPSAASRRLRDLLYQLGYQAPFSAQVDPDAARAGLLWQKLIRRAAGLRFGSERHVADTYALYFDEHFGAYAEINEWVPGRTWRLEADPALFRRAERLAGGEPDSEYLAKRRFLSEFARLLREMGAVELARQYEWGTWKSQPNVLRRTEGGEELTAIDFRAGLVLLPGLPLSPAVFRLIAAGLRRGRLAQFDGCDLAALEAFVRAHPSEFADLAPTIAELTRRDRRYRDALPDLLNRPWRLVTLATSRELHASLARGWQRAGLIDGDTAGRLAQSRLRFHLYNLLWWAPLAGRPLMRLCGDAAHRRRVRRALTSPSEVPRHLRAWRLGTLIRWHRDGRVGGDRAVLLSERPVRLAAERLVLGWLPARWHRTLAEPRRLRRSSWACMAGPIRLCADPRRRARWLVRQLVAARDDGMITPAEVERLNAEVDDPQIHRYLRCLAVLACISLAGTLLRVVLAVVLSIWMGGSVVGGLGIAVGFLAATQVLPITPGSLARGVYVASVMIRERNVRDYGLGALISFWHYVGHLGIPIQMIVRHGPLARVLVALWARRAVRCVPVFGERGALLEHKVFDLVFNLPLSLHASRARHRESPAGSGERTASNPPTGRNGSRPSVKAARVHRANVAIGRGRAVGPRPVAARAGSPHHAGQAILDPQVRSRAESGGGLSS